MSRATEILDSVRLVYDWGVQSVRILTNKKIVHYRWHRICLTKSYRGLQVAIKDAVRTMMGFLGVKSCVKSVVAAPKMMVF